MKASLIHFWLTLVRNCESLAPDCRFMILVCPECSTNYDLPNGLPEGGGKVRCTGCAHVWHATEADLMDAKPSDSTEEEEIPAVSPHEVDPLEELDFNEIEDEIAAQAEEEQAQEEQGQDDIDALFDEIEEPPVEETQDQSGIDDLFDAPLEEAAGEDNSQDDIDGLFDEPDDGGEDNSQDDIDGLFDEPDDGGEDNSQDDIDGLFDEPDEGGDDNSQDDIDGLFDEEESSDAAP